MHVSLECGVQLVAVCPVQMFDVDIITYLDLKRSDELTILY